MDVAVITVHRRQWGDIPLHKECIPGPLCPLRENVSHWGSLSIPLRGNVIPQRAPTTQMTALPQMGASETQGALSHR